MKTINNARLGPSLATTLAVAFLAVSLIALFISGGLQVISNIQIQQGAISNYQQYVAQEAGAQVRDFILSDFDVLETAAWLTPHASASAEEQRQVLQALLGREPSFRNLILFDGENRTVATASRMSTESAARLSRQFDDDFFAAVRRETRYVGSVDVDPGTSEPMVVMAVPVENVFGDFQGTLAAEVNLKAMWELVDQIKVGSTGRAYVVNRNGDLIAFEDSARVLKGENESQLIAVRDFMAARASDPPPAAKLHQGIMGDTVVGTYVPLETPDWAVATEMPWEEAYRNVFWYGGLSAGLTLAVAVCAGLLGVSLARRLTVPVVHLTKTAAAIAGGELGMQVPVQGPREIGQLAHAFNSMTGQLRATLDSLEERVAETKRAQESLRMTKETLQALFDYSPLSLSVLDGEGCVTLWNKASERMYGWTADEVLGRRTPVLLAEHEAEYQSIRKRLYGGEIILDLETERRRKDGTLLPVSLSMAPLRDAAGNTTATMGIAADITDRKRVEKALRESEERYRLISQTVSDWSASWCAGPDGRWAPEWRFGAFESITGYTDAELQALNGLSGIVYPDDHEELEQRFDRGNHGTPSHGDIRLVAKNGRVRWLALDIQPIWDDTHQRVMRVLTSVREITDRKMVEDALRVSERKLAEVFRASPELISVSTVDEGRFLEVNDAYEHVLGFRREEIVGHTALELGLWQTREDRERVVGLVKEPGGAHNVEVRMGKKSGELFDALVSMAPITYGGQPCLITLITDITERKQAEDTLRKLSRQDEQALRIAHMAYWEYDLENRVLLLNDQYYALYGTTADQAGGYRIPVDEFTRRYVVDPSDRAIISDVVRKAVSSDTRIAAPVYMHIRWPDGTLRDAAVEFRVERDDQGRAVKIYGVTQDITERRQVDEALKESQAILQATTESIKDGLLVVSRDGVISHCNSSFCEMWGVPADLGAQNDQVVVNQVAPKLANPEAFLARVRQIYQTGEMSEDVFALTDGRVFERYSYPLVREGEQHGRVWLFRDITERRKTETILELYQFTFEHIRDAVHWMDASGRLLNVNEATCRVLGYTKNELLAMTVLDIDPTLTREIWDEQWAAARAAGSRLMESIHKTKDGRMFPVELSVNFMVYGGRELVCAFARDITARKQAEQALLESEARFRAVFEKGQMGVVLVGRDGTYSKVNRSFSTMVGYSSEELYTKSFQDVTHPDDRAETERQAEALWRNEISFFKLEKRYVHKDGRVIWGLTAVSLVRDKQGAPAYYVAMIEDITARKQAEQALQESQARFRTVVENAQAAIFILDANGIFRLSEGRALARLGLAPGQIVGQSAFEYSAAMPDVITAIQKALRGELVHATSRLRGLVFDMVISPHFAPDGELVGVIGIAIDITDQRRAEQALQESEERLKKAQAMAHVGNWDLDLQTKNIRASEEALRIYGLEPSLGSLSLQVAQSGVLAEYRPGMDAALAALITDGTPYDLEFQLRREDNGKVRFIHSLAECQFDEGGKPVRVVGVLQDITERKEVERALRLASFALERVADAMFWIEPTGHIVDVNESACSSLGYSREELKTMSLADLDPDLPVERWSAMWERFRQVGRYQIEQTLRTKDGRRVPFEVLSSYVQFGGLELDCALARDITQRKEAEERIRRLNEELEQRVVERTAQLESANKELEAFSYSVSHDLRAPLRAIDGYSRILLEDYAAALDADGRRVCAVVCDETRRMGQLIDDLLSFSRLSRTEMQFYPIDMEPIVNSLLPELTAPEGRERIEIEIDPLPQAFGDPSLIRQVWVNLLSNAVKFSSKRERAVIHVGGQLTDAETIYWVRDNGAGFDMKYAHKLFGVFQRLHSEREFKGTGVGLAIVQRIVRRHGGRAWGEGEIDHGATMYFALPRHGGLHGP